LLSVEEPFPQFPTVVMTSQGDEKAAVEAMKSGALDYVVKSAGTLADAPHLADKALREWGFLMQRKRAEAALAQERELLAVTLRSIGEGVLTTDAKGRITTMNRLAEGLTGWTLDEALGRPLADVFHIIQEGTRERCENPVDKVLDQGGVLRLGKNTVLIARDGTERVIAENGAPIRDGENRTLGVVLVFRDITETRRMEEELRRTQKLQSLSVLAGGIAHDFNNALMAIIGNVSLAKLYAGSEERVLAKLAEIERAALRTKDLTQQLLTFAKGGAPVKKAASLAQLVRETAEFGLTGSNVGCRFEIAEDLWPVEVDAGQISQVVSNLILNADQSMPDGGTVDINMVNERVTHSSSSPLKEGRYVKTTFRDHGQGIAREHLPKIFDPYFTTKQIGSGLGLSVAYSIIEKHDGYIAVESALNQGTAFTIYLPARAFGVVEPPRVPAPVKRGKGKVLLMDDEKDIREVGAEMLEVLGYEVESVPAGAEAVAAYRNAREQGTPFEVVILDLTVPGGLGGKETIGRILGFDPQAKVIVSSGYSNEDVMSRYEQYGFRGALSKPYRIQELGEILSTVLCEASEPPSS
jgi:PAS domain S-box-containing protein